ncbi:MAG: hypothetical protein EZS28_041914, partial [Streblomastix strix]
NPNMKMIITHIKTLINDSDVWTKSTARKVLNGLAVNAANKAEIEKGGFKIPQ